MLKPAQTITPTLTLLDVLALQVLSSVVKYEQRESAEGIALAYEIAREMMTVREGYEEVAQAQSRQDAPAADAEEITHSPSLAQMISEQAGDFARLIATGCFPLVPREVGCDFHLVPHWAQALERINALYAEAVRLHKAEAKLKQLRTLLEEIGAALGIWRTKDQISADIKRVVAIAEGKTHVVINVPWHVAEEVDGLAPRLREALRQAGGLC